MFVAGHSLTLLVATLAGWQVDAAVVDAIIAASVAYIGVRTVRGPPQRWEPTVVAIFLFGLSHCLGPSTRLKELPLPDGGALVTRIVAFNIGVEIGQLAALSLMPEQSSSSSDTSAGSASHVIRRALRSP